MNQKTNFLMVMIPVLLLAGAVVAGCQRADVVPAAAVDEAEQTAGPATTTQAKGETTSPEAQGAVARADDGEAAAKAGKAEARAGDGGAQAGAAGNSESGKARSNGAGPSGKVKLKVGGRPGAQFSGVCVVGGREREVSGRVPGRFVFESDEEVGCGIRNAAPDAGPLKFSVTSGGKNKQQKIRATAQNIDFTLSGNSVSYEATSSSGSSVSRSSSSVTQKTKVTSSSSSSSSSVSSSSSSR